MKSIHVLPFNEDMVRSVRFGEPSNMSRGGCTVSIFDDSGRKIHIQTPRCGLPFGVSTYGDKMSVVLSIENDPTFASTLEAMDGRVTRAIAENYPAWFGKEISDDAVRDIFTSNLRDRTTWRLALPIYGERSQVQFFNPEKEEISVDALRRGCEVRALVELTGLWFVDRRVGIKWKPVQIMVYPGTEGRYLFIDE